MGIIQNGRSAADLVGPGVRRVPIPGGGARLALIFDDGYRTNYTIAAPILAEYGFAATLAIEPEQVGQNYNSDSAYPVCTAADMRSLINDYGWEICNHPDLDTDATEATMVTEAQTENQLLVDLLTGAKVWNGSAFVAGSVTHSQYSDYTIDAAVYRGGGRNATSDLAYRYLFNYFRTINGAIASRGDAPYLTDPWGIHPQMWSAYSIDTNGNDSTLQSCIAYIQACGAHPSHFGTIYAHDTPVSSGGSSGAVYLAPYIHEAHLRALCDAAQRAGVIICPLKSLGNPNLVLDPRFEDANSHTFAEFSGDTAEYDADVSLHSGARSAKLVATGYRTNPLNTAWRSENFVVQPSSRYIMRYRYRIDTELVLNGGAANRNHGLAVRLNTTQANTEGTSQGSSDCYTVNNALDGTYARPYQATSGAWLEHQVEIHSGAGHLASASIGLFQCTGTAYIGHVSIEKAESLTRTPA